MMNKIGAGMVMFALQKSWKILKCQQILEAPVDAVAIFLLRLFLVIVVGI